MRTDLSIEYAINVSGGTLVDFHMRSGRNSLSISQLSIVKYSLTGGVVCQSGHSNLSLGECQLYLHLTFSCLHINSLI